ncbi:hypothetical protein JCM8547_002221 [Rhodosporidiobolus lusitaniae]
METQTAPSLSPAFTKPSTPSSSKVPRSLPNPALVKDVFGFPSSSKLANDIIPESSMLSVAAEYDHLDDDEEASLSRALKAKATVAPRSTRTISPAPLLWSERGWNAGHFTFSPFGAPSRTGDEANEASEKKVVGGGLTSPVSDEDVSVAGTVMERTPSSSSSMPARSASPVSRSKLAPTAQSFIPKVSALTPASPSQLATLNTAAPRPFPFHPRSGRSTGASSSPSSSPIEPRTPPPFSHAAHLDHDGHLITLGSRYTIADEILQLQGAPTSYHPDELETLAEFEAGPSSSRTRTVSEGSNFTRGIEHWRMQQSPTAPATFPLRQGSFPSLAGPSSASGSFERSRSSSIASTASSYFAPRPMLERSATAAQLQSYFGPSNVEVNAPLPAGYDYDPSYPSPHDLSRTSSYSNLHAAPYPVLAHPEPFNLTQDDPLYQQARDIFVESSCTSLNSPPMPSHRQSMAVHFDRAMRTLNPLATLYGLSQEGANQLLADPAKSGVNEVVLKVAAMRGRQEQMASVQRSAMGTALPGPSPNNRKLNLYKTELCRSWEEKGSCRYGVKCQFAHGIHELREVARHPKFKSEVCRTFWQQGSCPYGKRCCFIHATGDAAFEGGSSSPTKSSAPNSRAESPVEQITSRLGARMTSTAVTSAPSRTFGPALSELISSSSSSSNASSLQNSPKQPMRADFSSTSAALSSSSSTFETSALFGLGISQRPGQAPPTFREEPKSRLHRLTSISSLSTPSTVTSPSLPPFSFQPHSRNDSANSFATTSSSASSGPAYSPLLARSGSSSSLSSNGSPVLLRPLGGEWLGSAGSLANSKSASALDWPEIEHLSLNDLPEHEQEHLQHQL